MEILQKFNFYSKSKIKYVVGKRRKSDIVVSISNPKKIIQFIKWKPKFNNLGKIVKSCIAWEKKIN